MKHNLKVIKGMSEKYMELTFSKEKVAKKKELQSYPPQSPWLQVNIFQ